MSDGYKAILWNRQKKQYDRTLFGLLGLYFVLFVGITLGVHPEITSETLIIRFTATSALLLLHIILIIGPLCRLNPSFLPLLYNRRHLGVTMFFLALIHGAFSLFQFHALGDTPILLSLFTANPNYHFAAEFPFQIFGFFSLLILFLMAASSHDFWLKILGPAFWKSLHMGVYLVYFMLILHVFLGVVQLEGSVWTIGLLASGVLTVSGIHIAANIKYPRKKQKAISSKFIPVCRHSEIPENRARIIRIRKEEIAIFKYDGKLSAVRNECKHQLGPLGEGKIVDGCITCPWHGYQYLPESGASPPPFDEKVSTYDVQVDSEGMVFVNPKPHPEGTKRPPAILQKSTKNG